MLPLCAALVDGGLTALEITFTVPNACEVVAAVSRAFGVRATVGIGTVLTAFQLKSALDAGAVTCVGDDVRSLTCFEGKSATPHVVAHEDSLPPRHRPVA